MEELDEEFKLKIYKRVQDFKELLDIVFTLEETKYPEKCMCSVSRIGIDSTDECYCTKCNKELNDNIQF